MTTSVQDSKIAKKSLRKQMKAKVATISQQDKKLQSKIVTGKVLKSAEYVNSKSIALYLHMDDEIQTEDILIQAFKDEKICYIPRYFMGGNLMEMVRIYNLQDYENLPVTKWNIKQPSDEEKRPEALDEGSLDLMLIPGMAFTEKGLRLGRGKGYYDTYLAKAKSKEMNPKTLALAFNEQIVSEVPCDDHDYTIDSVIYPLKKDTYFERKHQ